MSQHEIGFAGILFAHSFPQAVDILHHPHPASFGAEIERLLSFRHRLPMAQMVIAHHSKPPLCQIPGKGFIAKDIFRQTMGDLQHSQHIPIRQELKNVQKELEGPLYKTARKVVEIFKLY